MIPRIISRTVTIIDIRSRAPSYPGIETYDCINAQKPLKIICHFIHIWRCVVVVVDVCDKFGLVGDEAKPVGINFGLVFLGQSPHVCQIQWLLLKFRIADRKL